MFKAHVPFWILIGLAFSLVVDTTRGDELPSIQDMQSLRPQPGSRLQLFDRIFPSTAQSAESAHERYSDPAVLADVERRLERVRLTGNPEDILDSHERAQFKANRAELYGLETSFFDRWGLRNSMDTTIRFQKWLTQRNSPEPQGAQREAVKLQLQNEILQNSLYQAWHQDLPSELKEMGGPKTWGDLLQQFQENANYRKTWVQKHPDHLPYLNELVKIWAWEDTNVRSVSVHGYGTPAEYWVLDRRYRFLLPNRFQKKIKGDIEGLIRLEYSPSVFFNRVSRAVKSEGTVVYHLEAVEKGRTMELVASSGDEEMRKRTFPGAELLRTTKADELLQRAYVQRKTLNLFLGLRTIQLDQVEELMRRHPELLLAVGQFGFSVTGGRAQTVSNRTDSPEAQARKLTATLIDIIEFAQTKNVALWFQDNVSQVLRTVLGGVGSGGSKALKSPGAPAVAGPSCRNLFERAF